MVDKDPHDRWRNRAACKAHEAEIFFAPDGARRAERFRREQQAKAICANCPVWTQCLDFALENKEEYGVWGGLTEDERRVMRRRLLGSTAIV